jgi:predicted enzyme related to lactoylglutathione lyase
MHKSKLAGFIIDCRTDDIDAATTFWSAALGYNVKPAAPDDDPRYRNLDADASGLHVEVQQVEHPSRVHLDIETDDIEAEVARLEKLGARRVNKGPRWWVMEAPTGQRFCVVRIQNADFANKANTWS